MELRHLRYFVAVAEELHFGRAADRLEMSQPPLSQQIRRLEGELGVELFRRTKRDVQLTAAGRVFLPRARGLLLEADRAVETARQAARGVVGRLEVGYIPTAEIRIVPRLHALFRKRLPRVELGLHQMPPAELADALRQSSLDVALVRLPMDEDGIRTTPFLREPLLVAVKAGSALSRSRSIQPEQLHRMPLLMFPHRVAPGLHDSIAAYFRNAGSAPSLRDAISSIGGGLGLVAAGVGVCLVPEAVRDVRFRGVTYRPLAGPGLWSKMAVAQLREPPTPLQEFFQKAIAELYPGKGGRR